MSPCAAYQTRDISSRVLIVDTAAAEESAPAAAEKAEPQEVSRKATHKVNSEVGTAAAEEAPPQEVSRRATWEVNRKGTQEMPQEVTY
jgi:hypothetical protein